MEAEKFGRFIAQCRKNREMTQKELARKLNVTEQAVSRWECGKGFPDIQLLVPLAESLEISVSELMNLEKKNGEKATETLTDGDVKRMLADLSEMEKKNQRENKNLTATCIVITVVAAAAAWLSGYASFLAAWILGAFTAVAAAGFLLFIRSGKEHESRRTVAVYLVLGIGAVTAMLFFMGVPTGVLCILLFIALCAVSCSG